MNHEWRPARGRLDKTEAQAGKFFRNPVGDQIAEGEDRQRPAVRERMIARVFEVRQHPRRAGAGMNADRHVELGGLLVDWMKIRMIDSLVAFDATEENADRA